MYAGSCNGNDRIGEGAGYRCWAIGFDRGIGLRVSGDEDALGKLKFVLNIDDLD
jgi:hypothetical protein